MRGPAKGERMGGWGGGGGVHRRRGKEMDTAGLVPPTMLSEDRLSRG